jgi:hypothetical protein
MWLYYNRAIIKFARQFADRCCVLELERLEQDYPQAVDGMRQVWKIDLAEVGVDTVMDSALLRSVASPEIKAACRRRRRVTRTHAALQELARSHGPR